MPTRPRSPVRSIHSWSLVYLNPSGYAIVTPGQARGPALQSSLFGAFVERHRHDPRARAAAADVDVEFRVERGVFDRQGGHADGFLHVRRLGAAGHGADLGVADIGVVAVAADAALEHLEADNLALRS